MSLLYALNAYFIAPLLSILIWTIIIGAILSWLVAFNVVNPRNQLVGTILRFVSAITEPLLAPFRRFVPPLGGIDITPILLILSIFFVRDWLVPNILVVLSRVIP